MVVDKKLCFKRVQGGVYVCVSVSLFVLYMKHCVLYCVLYLPCVSPLRLQLVYNGFGK